MTQEIRSNWQYVHIRRVVNVSFNANIECCSGIHKVEEGRRRWKNAVSDATTELLKVTS